MAFQLGIEDHQLAQAIGELKRGAKTRIYVAEREADVLRRVQASNQGPLNPALVDAVKGRVEALRAADPGNTAPVPVVAGAVATGAGAVWARARVVRRAMARKAKREAGEAGNRNRCQRP